MTPEQFCYWMKGFAELHGATPTNEQWESINEHLMTVFNKVTPTAPGELWGVNSQLSKLSEKIKPIPELTLTC